MTYVQMGDSYLDAETGEVLTAEGYALLVSAQAAAQAYRAYDRARLDLEALKQQIDEHIAAIFPEFALLAESVLRLKNASQEAQEALRAAALAQEALTGEKSLLGGVVTVATASRKTHYDATEAHDWCVEMKRIDLMTPNEKALTELAKAGQLPESVMRFEAVKETRVSDIKLSALPEEA